MNYPKPVKISLKFGTRIWQTNLVMLGLFLLLLCIFLALTQWQISRGIEKEAIISLAQKNSQLPITLLSPERIFSDTNTKKWKDYIYTNNQIQGRWLAPYTYLQDNITYDGVAGYEVLTPFQTLDGTVILINRGWISKNQYRKEKVILPIQIAQKKQRLEGTWVLPTQRFVLSDTPYAKNFPKIIQKVKPKVIAKEIKHSLTPLQLRLRKPLENSPLSIHWKPVFGSANKHYAYALQWFSFAVILVFLFIRLNLRKA